MPFCGECGFEGHRKFCTNCGQRHISNPEGTTNQEADEKSANSEPKLGALNMKGFPPSEPMP